MGTLIKHLQKVKARTMASRRLYCAKLFIFYIVYLAAGAWIFAKLENPNEVRQCKTAVKVTRNNQFIRSRRDLIKLGFGPMICKGISIFFDNLVEDDYILQTEDAQNVSVVLRRWQDHNCTLAAYDSIIKVEVQQNEQNGKFINQFHRAWQQSYQLSVENLTENDILKVPNKALIEALASAAKYSIDDYTFLQRDCYGGTSRWDFHNAFFFAGTLVSTIGYGNVSPVTPNGKLFCIFFVAFGVPYFAYLLTILSEVISDALRIAGEKFNFNRGVEEKAGGLNMVSILYILIDLWVPPSLCSSLLRVYSDRRLVVFGRCLLFLDIANYYRLWRFYSFGSATS